MILHTPISLGQCKLHRLGKFVRGHSRKLNLDEDGHRESDAGFNERDQDEINLGKDLQVENEAEFDNPFPARSADFLWGRKQHVRQAAVLGQIEVASAHQDDADDQLHDQVNLEVDGALELEDEVDVYLDFRAEIHDDRLAVAALGVVAGIYEKIRKMFSLRGPRNKNEELLLSVLRWTSTLRSSSAK
jgi:hypothetical protein